MLEEQIQTGDDNLRQKFSQAYPFKGGMEVSTACLDISVDAQVRQHPPIYSMKRPTFVFVILQIFYWQIIYSQYRI